jgi:nicotinate phosphoribosyltransferase
MAQKNNFITPLLTDLYQLTMAYAYWKSGIAGKQSVFDLFFRKNPFSGAFTIFAGLGEALSFLGEYRFTDEQIAYIRRIIPGCEEDFFVWLSSITCSGIKVYAIDEGSVVFPREPIMRVEGPLAICQLLETTLLALVNFASLVATNAARFRIAAGMEATLVEFGLRRAQGPDGGVSASRYSYMGGFDGTSNLAAGELYGIPVRGTHAHSFVQAFHGLGDIEGNRTITGPDGKDTPFVQRVLDVRNKLGFTRTNEGELAAFMAYARAFPRGFLALVDTYDTLSSGVPNFISVATALADLGFSPLGIRLDSGDLAYLSRESRRMMRDASEKTGTSLSSCKITASNDLNEEVLLALKAQGHEIDVFGIGTHLVTCQAQPALGCVYKLVEIEGSPRIKLSQQVEKVTIPGRKDVYRLYGKNRTALADIMVLVGETPPSAVERILCVHPFDDKKRVYVIPEEVAKLTACVWDGKILGESRTIGEIRDKVLGQLAQIRTDYARPVNPASYKVSVTSTLYKFIHELWAQEAPIVEIR